MRYAMRRPQKPRSCDVSAIIGYLTDLEKYITELELYCTELSAARTEGLVTTQEAAELLHCDRRHVAKLFHAKRITGVQCGAIILLEKVSVLSYQTINANSEEGRRLGLVKIAT